MTRWEYKLFPLVLVHQPAALIPPAVDRLSVVIEHVFWPRLIFLFGPFRLMPGKHVDAHPFGRRKRAGGLEKHFTVSGSRWQCFSEIRTRTKDFRILADEDQG